MNTRHKLAVIGLDNWYHAFPVAKYCQSGGRLELVGAADADQTKLERYRQEFGVPAIYQDWRELLVKSSCEIVMVSSASVNHEEIAVEAAKCGKHILCDKPMALTADAAERIMAAVTANKVGLAMIHNYRFSPALRSAKSLLESGSIGKVNSVTFNSRAPLPEDWPGSGKPGWYAEPARSGGGGFIDHASHVIDAVLWFLDERMPVSVVGSISNLLPCKLPGEDYGVAMLDFGSVMAIIECSWTTPPNIGYSEFVQIVGDQGELFIHRAGHPYLEFRLSKDNVRLRRMEYDEPVWTDILMDTIEAFLDHLENGTPNLTSGWQGVNAVKILDSFYKSVSTGAKVVL